MRSTTALLLLATLLSSPAASAPATPPDPSKSSEVTIMLCQNAGTDAGECRRIASNPGASSGGNALQLDFDACYQFGHMDDRISQYAVFGPACCGFYRKHDCKGPDRMFFVKNKADKSLGKDNDDISSMRCQPDCGRFERNEDF